jgi:hypothetical protein
MIFANLIQRCSVLAAAVAENPGIHGDRSADAGAGRWGERSHHTGACFAEVPGNRKCPRNAGAFFFDQSFCKMPSSLLPDSDLFGNILGPSRGSAMPGDVSLFVAISTDEPLFIEPGRMLRNAREVDHFICSRLLCHPPTTLFAIFCSHCFSSTGETPMYHQGFGFEERASCPTMQEPISGSNKH